MNKENYEFERKLIVEYLQGYIIEKYHPTNAKEYEILGRAVVGCECIALFDDGSILNAYRYGKRARRSYPNAEWRASELIDEALNHYKALNRNWEE